MNIKSMTAEQLEELSQSIKAEKEIRIKHEKRRKKAAQCKLASLLKEFDLSDIVNALKPEFKGRDFIVTKLQINRESETINFASQSITITVLSKK